MMLIKKSELLVSEAELQRALLVYKQALLDHAHTVDVPAPWPEYDILWVIVKNGGDFAVVDDLTPALFQNNALMTAQRHATWSPRRFTDRKPK